jgi:hypothetical protein
MLYFTKPDVLTEVYTAEELANLKEMFNEPLPDHV